MPQPKAKSKKLTIVHIPAFKYKQGYVMSWDVVIKAVSGAQVVEFKGTQVGGPTFRDIAKAMKAGNGVLLTPIVLNGEEKDPPFQGPGIQLEVGPEARYNPDAGTWTRKWVRQDQKPFYSRIRVAHGAWMPSKMVAPTVVRLEPRIVKQKRGGGEHAPAKN